MSQNTNTTRTLTIQINKRMWEIICYAAITTTKRDATTEGKRGPRTYTLNEEISINAN